MSDSSDNKSLQEQYSPSGTCFGCGPANEFGLQIRSFYENGKTVCHWQPKQHHEAFDGFLNGGIISSLLDCHCNWAAIAHHISQASSDEAPCTVTAKLEVQFLAPTPTENGIDLVAEVVDATERKFKVAGEISAGGEVTARCEAVFVAVNPGHPAYHRW